MFDQIMGMICLKTQVILAEYINKHSLYYLIYGIKVCSSSISTAVFTKIHISK